MRREPGRDGKILSDHRQDGNDEVHRLQQLTTELNHEKGRAGYARHRALYAGGFQFQNIRPPFFLENCEPHPRSSIPKGVTSVGQLSSDAVIEAVGSLVPGIDGSPPLPEARSTRGYHPADRHRVCLAVASRVRVSGVVKRIRRVHAVLSWRLYNIYFQFVV